VCVCVCVCVCVWRGGPASTSCTAKQVCGPGSTGHAYLSASASCRKLLAPSASDAATVVAAAAVDLAHS
jgi:hypothetical protein